MSGLVVRALQAHELEWLNEGEYTAEHWLSKPGFTLRRCRVAVLNGQIVAQTMVEPHTLLYGRARLRVAHLHPIYTEPAFRRRGCAQALVRDALALMMEEGAHLALGHVHTDEGTALAERFGFNPVWPYYGMEIDSAAAARLESDARLRAARSGDVRSLAALYERHWGRRVTFARSVDWWHWRLTHPGAVQVAVAELPNGEVGGYLAGQDLVSAEAEIVVNHPQAAAVLMGEVARMHLSAGMLRVHWLLPPDDALISFARQHVDVTVSAYFPRSYGWHARIIDAPALVEALLPEITAQAQVRGAPFDPAALVFDYQPGSVQISLRGKPETRCLLDHREFIQVVFGLLNVPLLHRQFTPQAEALLQALFPQRVAAIAPWDLF